MSEQKRYGIRITLPQGDPLALPHLLGSDWESFRWYRSAEERNRAMEDMGREHQFSRKGDIPSITLEAVDR
ncbi:hypothetical protein VCB98_06350 [Gammaproteobacteria bacterium AB-CW1]|uniref:Uncharacterized protein n=1 Tax=Natronospira elongata TaxID=3110268 RepID=A0AAP6MML0_9GAMM|nr:hypothetical protein [Gammaproteobacteria bacterium AB-CW1]